MTAPDNLTIAAALERIALLLERDGVEATPVAAYRRAAGLIRLAVRPVHELIEEDGVEALHHLGIGYLISGMVTDWVRSGQLPLLERLERRVGPEACLQRVPGIGKKLAREVRELGIEDVGELASAAADGRLEQVCGFGPKRIALLKRVLPRPCRQAEPVQLDLIAAG